MCGSDRAKFTRDAWKGRTCSKHQPNRKQTEEAAMTRRHSFAAITALTIGLYAGATHGRGGMPPENPWNPQHIDSLPSEIRAAIAPFARLCGGPLAAQHAFARYLEKGGV